MWVIIAVFMIPNGSVIVDTPDRIFPTEHKCEHTRSAMDYNFKVNNPTYTLLKTWCWEVPKHN